MCLFKDHLKEILRKRTHINSERETDNRMEEKDSTNLELDAHAAAYRVNVRSSLTDLNGIPLFTDEFVQIRQDTEEEIQREQEELQGKTFTEQMLVKETDSVLSQMFTVLDTQTIVRAQRQEQTAYSISEMIGSILLAGTVLLVGIWMFVRKKGNAGYDNDNQLPVEA